MIEIPGRIPISIHPLFWLFAALIGWLYSQTLGGMMIWVGIIVVSVLFHEFGHALTAVLFRQKAAIQLVALGGLTSYEGPKLSWRQQFIIILNGPIAGFILCLIATALLRLPVQGVVREILYLAQIANLFWSVINLVPVLPLDGGQLLRVALEGFFGVKGFKASLLIGASLAFLISLYFFLLQALLVGALFFLFAFQSFDLWRKSRSIHSLDREEELRKKLLLAEECLQQGDKQRATQLLQELRLAAPGGLLAASASQYLAFLLFDEGKRDEAYQLLLPFQKQLKEDGLCLLQELAAEKNNPALVAELSVECYQFAPNRDVAMRNARAFALLKQPEPAGGWLQTAWQHGAFNVDALLTEQAFDDVRNDPAFRQFVDPLQS